jgi:hypothetical protein
MFHPKVRNPKQLTSNKMVQKVKKCSDCEHDDEVVSDSNYDIDITSSSDLELDSDYALDIDILDSDEG